MTYADYRLQQIREPVIVALHDADRTRFPNLALMKLAAWHKAKGHGVLYCTFGLEWGEPGGRGECIDCDGTGWVPAEEIAEILTS